MPKDISGLSVQGLAELIERANARYDADGINPELTDPEYDSAMRRLKELDPENPLLERVSAPLVAGIGKIHHEKPMLSLDKVYSIGELLEWCAKFARSQEEEILVQPKYDGISALWDGVVLSTRGDGHDGENISDKVPAIELEAPSFRAPLTEWNGGCVLGEILIREDDFKNVYSKVVNRNGKPYKNSRNAVAGIMGLKDISPMLAQGAKISFVDYNLFSERIKVSELEKRWEGLEKELKALPYPMDGIVVKLADAAYSASLGSTAHHPRGQIAYKFGNGEGVRTKLLNVTWSFGKNCLTPLAEFEPVEIGGTTIRRATLHNLQNILDRDIMIGDCVRVKRAGDVIPFIASSEPGENRTSCLITHCPSCGAELVRDLPELRCVNPECFETRLQKLLASAAVLGIDGIGEATMREMIKVFGLKDITPLFKMESFEFRQIQGVKETSAKKLYDQIQSAKKNMSDWKILTVLNIKGVGANLAKQILEQMPLAEVRKAEPEQLSSLRGVGPERAAVIVRGLAADSKYIDALLEARDSAPPETDLFGF